MSIAEEVLSTLKDDDVWYFAKQDASFDNVYQAVRLFDNAPKGESPSSYYQSVASNNGLDSNVRILSVAQLMGLLTKSSPFSRAHYDVEKPTPAFRELERHPVGSREYNAIKTEQLLKIRMKAITDTRATDDYGIYPFLFIAEVLWRLSLKGIRKIPRKAFFQYVMTSKAHENLESCVEILSQEEKDIAIDEDKVKKFMSDSRVETIIKGNMRLFNIDSKYVRIDDNFVNYYSYFFNGPYKGIVALLYSIVDDVAKYQDILTRNIGISLNFIDAPEIKPDGSPSLSILPLTKIKNSSSLSFLTAIRTKPFILLAGISGTGKSRIVREFAFKSCPKCLQDKDGTTPGNYCMIEVKPNWHDSTELLGYYSNLSKGYQFKKFVKFLVKAKMYPKVPFFVCLDEMNLAPVEQYFAEILSILETRKHPKDTETGKVDMSTVKTEVIVDARYFRELSEMSHCRNIETGETATMGLTDKAIYLKLFGINTKDAIEKEEIDDEVGVRQDLTTEGLALPDNVVVIGTVNMDDTTHQFSRKVIDRAMTIEMNGGNLRNMFGGSKNLEYLPEKEQKAWQDAFVRRYVTADEVLDAHPDEAKKLVEILPARLEEINNALKGTPFEVSYRVLNELAVMVGVMLDDNKDDKELDDIINQAVNYILLMKVLPRIEGDTEMFALSKEYKAKMGVNYVDRLEWLKNIAPDLRKVTKDGVSGDEETVESGEKELKGQQNTSKDKIQEMIDRLNNQDFTRFWP